MDRETIKDIIEGIIGWGLIFFLGFLLFVIGG